MFDLSPFSYSYRKDPWDLPYGHRLARLKKGTCRITYFYETPDNSTFRYRVYNMLQAADASSAGLSASFFHLGDLRNVHEILDHTDVLVLCRTKYSPEVDQLVFLARSKNKRLLFDVDDLVFDTRYVNLVLNTLDQSVFEQENLDHWHGRFSRMGAVLKMCDGAITTNPFLAQRIHEFAGIPVFVVPNFLNREQLEISQKIFEFKKQRRFRGEGLLEIGYFSGTPTHNKDLGMLLADLDEILKTYPQVGFVIAGYMEPPERLKAHEGRLRKVPFTDFINLQAVVGGTEINVVPLQDNVFTNCKSELKYFEAAMVGTVTVASPTFTYRNAITDGTNGYLAKSYEWFSKLSHVIENYADLEALRVEANASAMERYAFYNQASLLEEIFLNGSKGVIGAGAEAAV